MAITEALVEVVEGWTDALPFTLNADGVPVDITGLTVKLYLKDNRGTLVQSGTSALAVTDATGGTVTYTPQTTDELLASRTPYKIRFSLSDVTTATAYFPNVDEDLIKVNVL